MLALFYKEGKLNRRITKLLDSTVEWGGKRVRWVLGLPGCCG